MGVARTGTRVSQAGRRGIGGPGGGRPGGGAAPRALACLVLLASLAPGPVAAQVRDPLSFMEPLLGVWVPAPTYLAEHPEYEDLVMLDFEWGTSRRSLSYRAGLPTADGAPFTHGIVVWNPDTETAEFLASQGNDGLLFRGYYESLDESTVRRVYWVYYADREPIRYRETFFMVAPDTIDWLTEWHQEGEWRPRRGSGAPQARAVRVSARTEMKR